ncbi:MAG: ComEA family DNA-binding protein [Flavobacteriales bacterium]
MNIKDYFSFTKGEKRGVVFLLMLIILFTTSLFFIKNFKSNSTTNFSAFENEITHFENELKTHLINDSLARLNRQTIYLPDSLFDFNPNTINDSDWVKLGFKEWQVKTINNYKTKGGKFRFKSDVSKIFGITDTLYQMLFPYILLPEKTEKESFQNTYTNKSNNSHFEPFTKKETIIVDINLADTSEFKSLKGIGSAFSKRIVNYRESLGGFISTEQLKEVYGINDEIFNSIKPFVKISNKNPNLININHVDLETLKKHPYIDWKIAKTIITYRNSHGNYKDVNDIRQIHLVTDEIYTKIAPYLTIK